jgi:hypothetical protein
MHWADPLRLDPNVKKALDAMAATLRSQKHSPSFATLLKYAQASDK